MAFSGCLATNTSSLATTQHRLSSTKFEYSQYVIQLDATLFGHLVQFVDPPIHSKAIKPLLEKSAPNLLNFVQRVKRRYWPDWEEITEHLALNPEDVGANPPAHSHQQHSQKAH